MIKITCVVLKMHFNMLQPSTLSLTMTLILLKIAPLKILKFSFANKTPESLQAFPLNVNPELFLDTLLLEIRRVSIQFAAAKKRNRIAEEQSLLNDLEILENLSHVNPNDDTLNELNDKREALEQIYNYQAQGAYIIYN